MNKQLFDERKKLFYDAMRLQHTERTPMYANIMTWKILDEGYKLPDAVYDLDTYEKIIRAHMDRYQFDMYNDFGSTGILALSKALGVSNFTISENGEEFTLRQAMPKICVFGGLNVSMLRYSTPEECVAFTKQLIDDFGDGLVLTSYKALTYKNDCARENLLAINNFVREYKH